MKILIYGGLRPAGFGLTSYFLEEGIETSVIKSNIRSEEEEEAEFFVGRNALFHSVDPDQRGNEGDAELVCLTNFLGDWDEGGLEFAEHLFEEAVDEKRCMVLFTMEEGCPNDGEKKHDKPYKLLEESFKTYYEKTDQESPWLVIRVSEEWVKAASSGPNLKGNQKELFQSVGDLFQSKKSSGFHIYDLIAQSKDEGAPDFQIQEIDEEE